jgi:hypothetical protein
MPNSFSVRACVAISIGLLPACLASPADSFCTGLRAQETRRPPRGTPLNQADERSKNNLKQIAAAIRKCHDAQGHLPARAIFDKSGKPLLSWRVLILPYLGQAELFKQFRLDEAWDSPHNKPLTDRMPSVFSDPDETKPSARTRYQLPTGKGTIFEGDRGLKLSEIKKTTEFTIMVVETARDCPVVWTQPADLQFDPDHPLTCLKNSRPSGFLVASVSGSVYVITKSIDLSALCYMFGNVPQQN